MTRSPETRNFAWSSEDNVHGLSVPVELGFNKWEYVMYDDSQDLTWVALLDHDQGISLAFAVEGLKTAHPHVIPLYPREEKSNG